MPTYIVGVREVHVQPVKIEAADEAAAMEAVADGEGDYEAYDLEYSHTLDRDLWTVELKDW